MYIDEVQDHTQAELKLFVLLCAEPEGACFTGDTAQAISKGVAFRFTDITTLYFEAAKAVTEADTADAEATAAAARAAGRKNVLAVIPPPRFKVPVPLQLTYNYRSHAGILQLAAATITALQCLFPKSIDVMKRDRGMFPGPKPQLLKLRNRKARSMGGALCVFVVTPLQLCY